MLTNSTLGERCPIQYSDGTEGMILNSTLTVSAWDSGMLVTFLI